MEFFEENIEVKQDFEDFYEKIRRLFDLTQTIK